ncbi:type VI secretion system baseplate subunit TssK [Massilia orientalis]|uniref:Type VI secretion system baseplate subunit TssK n=1 Tax=Massilia orientalis TaxID=3050128 RepID=A0ACC7MBA2_9BURK|nr:type VI secretion system baseplate subunit TssK [Massilia sp. YIM B02787]
MKTPSKILWTEGVTLRPQHFQQQDRYHEARLHRMTAALHPYAWGLAAEAIWDEEALANNILRPESLSLVFQDGETYDAPGSDPLPEAVELAELPSSEHHFTFYAALPAHILHGGNLAGVREQDKGQARFRQIALETPDLYTDALDANIVYLAKQARLLSHLAPRAGDVSVPVLRLRRRGGGFEIDPTFIAPSLSVAAAPALARLLDALMQKLQAKIDALYAAQREPSKDVVVQGGDMSSFWLLQTISAGCAALHHHAQGQKFHPERLFQDLLGLAGGLMAFSRKIRVKDLPAYDHEAPGPAFARLDAVLRDLVDTVISSKFVAIPLVQDSARPSYFEGKLPDTIDQKTLLCLGVRADLPALELVALVPARFKIGAPDDIGRLVASALPGVELMHMPQVPAAVPIRPNTYYFALQDKGPLYANMVQGRAVSVYVPSGIRDLALELFAIAP